MLSKRKRDLCLSRIIAFQDALVIYRKATWVQKQGAVKLLTLEEIYKTAGTK